MIDLTFTEILSKKYFDFDLKYRRQKTYILELNLNTCCNVTYKIQFYE